MLGIDPTYGVLSFIVFYQLIWLGLFIYHGRSMVTSSEISIPLERDRILSLKTSPFLHQLFAYRL